MSAMNETDSHVSKNNSIGSPSSPSSLSSASSTTSNHSSSHTSAVQAAVQALLAQQQPNLGLLTSQAESTKSNLQAIQQQQQLNQLLASIAAAQQQHSSSNQSTSALLNTLMQQQLELVHSNTKNSSSKPTSSKNLNVKTKTSNNGRSLKGNSVSPPGTSSTCSDQDHHEDLHSPSNSTESLSMVKNEPHFSAESSSKNSKSNVKSEFEDLDRSTNSSASQDQAHPADDDDLHDELDDYETSFSRDSKRHRNHSTSSRTHSSNPHSRSTSPSSTSYHDSPAAFPTLESATAMLGGLNCTPNFLDTSMEGGMKKRRLTGSESKKIKPVPADKKDDAYWERRRKNNEAAKRSRDLRRQKEDEIAVKATVLEQENLKLKAQVTILKAELSKLHFMLYNR